MALLVTSVHLSLLFLVLGFEELRNDIKDPADFVELSRRNEVLFRKFHHRQCALPGFYHTNNSLIRRNMSGEENPWFRWLKKTKVQRSKSVSGSLVLVFEVCK